MVTRERAAAPKTTVKHRARRGRTASAGWSLLSPQGRVLFYIALCPRSTVAEIARAQGQTERAVWGIIRMLRRAGMVSVLKDGRRHRYIVNLDAPLLHPTIRGVTLRPILGELAARAEREPRRHCIDGG